MYRKEKIIEEIKKSEKPVSASALAKKLGVSRQIIVGDVALIRASGTNIIATPRGYILDNHQLQHTYTLAVKHTQEQLADELKQNKWFVETITREIKNYLEIGGMKLPGENKIIPFTPQKKERLKKLLKLYTPEFDGRLLSDMSGEEV